MTLRSGYEVLEVVVESIDGDYAQVIDAFGRQRSIRCDVRRGNGPLPRRGEVWLLDRTLGSWTFAACLESRPPTVTGDTLGAPAVDGLLSALSESGAVVNATTSTPSAAVDLSPFASLRAALAAGQRSVAIGVLGDSTGNDTTEWVYRVAQALAAENPGWTVAYRLWSDATQDYRAPLILQSGPNGDRYLDGSTGTTTRRLDPAASPHISGVLDVRVKVALPDWTPSANVVFCGKSGAEGTRGWYFGVNTAGVPFFTFSANGLVSGLVTKFSNAGGVGFVDGTTQWMRVVFTPNNGASGYDIAFYKGTDGITWTQLGTTITTAGATSLFNNAAVGYEIGGVASGVTALRLYEVQIRDGLNGPSVVPALPDLWPPYNINAAKVVGSPVLTIVNGSHPGATISYLSEVTRSKRLTPDYGQAVVLLSSSHNEGLAQGKGWIATLDSWRNLVGSLLPVAPQVLLTQNPEVPAPTNWSAEHAQRRLHTLAYGASRRAYVLDVYRAFLEYGAWESLLADPVHPNPDGSALWAEHVLAAYRVG